MFIDGDDRLMTPAAIGINRGGCCWKVNRDRGTDSSVESGVMAIACEHASVRCGLYSQANKRKRWMPWQSEAMKDVAACDKRRGGGKQPSIRRFPNGETHLVSARYHTLNP